MVGKSFSNVPPNLEDTQALKRYLISLSKKVDEAYGNLGNAGFTSNPKQGSVSKLDSTDLEEIKNKINILIDSLKASNIIS